MDARELVPIVAQAALCLIIASIGMQARARDVLAAMRNTNLVLKGLLAVNIVVPIIALIITSILPIHPFVRAGIVIMAVSPMAPLVQMKMLKGGLDTSHAIGLYVALILSAILFVPATVALLGALYPGEASISTAMPRIWHSRNLHSLEGPLLTSRRQMVLPFPLKTALAPRNRT